MGAFASEFFWKYLRDFRAWASVAGLLCIAFSAVMQHSFILPLWLWAFIATGCAFWMAWRAEKQAYLAKHAEVKCDVSLEGLLNRVIGDDLSIREASNMAAVDRLFASIRERAHQKTIKVWGRRTGDLGSNPELFVRNEIPYEYWDEFGISYEEMLADRRGKTRRVRQEAIPLDVIAPAIDTIYCDLYFSEVQVNCIWPAPKKKLNFKWPILQMPISLTPKSPRR
jgi:hypothetical protein